MKNLKRYGMMLGVALFSVALASADDWDKKTIITTKEAIQLPTVTLQPGTYVFMLDRGGDVNRHIVRVWDKDQKHLITTIFAAANEKIRPTSGTTLTFWETPAGQPKALRAWFWPGDTWGQEFKYPKESAERLNAYNKSQGPVPTTSEQPEQPKDNSSNTVAENAPSTPPAPSPEVAQAEPVPQAAPVPQAPVRTETQTAQVQAPPQYTPPAPPAAAPQQTAANQLPDRLPQTGSDGPLAGLIGLLSMAAYLALSYGRANS